MSNAYGAGPSLESPNLYFLKELIRMSKCGSGTLLEREP